MITTCDLVLQTSFPCQSAMVSRQRWCSCLPGKEGWAFRVAAAYGASWADCLSQVHVLCTTGVHTPGVGRAAIQSSVCSGSPIRCRSNCSRRHGGARVVQILGPPPPRPAARRFRGGRVVSWLAISRICCSRHPLCNTRAFATSVHGPPTFAGISTWAMRFKAFHQPPHQLGDHFHGRRVPHVAPRPFAFAPPRG